MCRRGLQETWRSGELRSGSDNRSSTLGALCWNKAALELRHSRRAVVQAPPSGSRGRGSTRKGLMSTEPLKAMKLEIQQEKGTQGTADMEEQRDIGDPGSRGPLQVTQLASRVDEESGL
ncbi:hypothetical protein NDU88_004222 [Pleurodeles waltl]|uniref:Uncharacterized protein n=1 Tax=Pleurodeles waltl TaxID=8319 RepID=A0AAV7LHM4_PLEWA|nr:hypothetical protein NDU88_004222 [Pleurodeles waltl]